VDPVGSTSLCRIHILIKGLPFTSDLDLDLDPDLYAFHPNLKPNLYRTFSVLQKISIYRPKYWKLLHLWRWRERLTNVKTSTVVNWCQNFSRFSNKFKTWGWVRIWIGNQNWNLNPNWHKKRCRPQTLKFRMVFEWCMICTVIHSQSLLYFFSWLYFSNI
jgi:hypothetical protein